MPDPTFSREEVLAMAGASGIEVHDRKQQARFGIDALIGEDSTEKLQRMCELAAAAARRKHQADIERRKGEAAKAEHWRALALAKDPLGAGQMVQVIQHAAAVAEREACAKTAASHTMPYGHCQVSAHAADMTAASIALALRARGLEHPGPNVPPAVPPNVPAESSAGAGLSPGGTLSVPAGPKSVPSTCWCETCRPITLADARMVLCPVCGNKRCPHATHHANACTASNAPGQPGSSWEHVKPAAPGGEHGGQ